MPYLSPQCPRLFLFLFVSVHVILSLCLCFFFLLSFVCCLSLIPLSISCPYRCLVMLTSCMSLNDPLVLCSDVVSFPLLPVSRPLTPPYSVLQQIGPFIQQSQAECDACEARGFIVDPSLACVTCHGDGTVSQTKVLDVFVEKGMKDGTLVRFSGEADQKVRACACYC